MAKSKLTKTGYELESVSIIQTEISPIEHREECDPTITMCGRKVYPVIVSPMGAVTNENNYKTWLENGFICVVPRTVDIEKRLEICEETFASFSLKEAEEVLYRLRPDKDGDGFFTQRYVCIDIAHGTMEKLYNVCRLLKQKFGKYMEIMTGNVANPQAYLYYCRNEIDFCRLSIGSGSRCVTRCNVGVGFPSATLIDETRMEKEKWEERNEKSTKIIMDGGISNFDDIQKSICLGANAVMSGSIFAKAQEACEPIVFLQPDNLNMADAIPSDEYVEKLAELKEKSDSCDSYDNEYWEAYKKMSKRKPYRLYYGMSCRRAQKITGGKGNKTSEGIEKPIPVEYPIAKWADNMASYMKSCMSYTGCRTIQEMIDNTELIVNLSSDKSFRK